MDACADCDSCRFLMDKSCLLFPELYRLYDKEKDERKPVSNAELRNLAELCTLCGLCPCPNIRSDVIRGKTERVRKEGMPIGTRLLTDVQHFGRWGGLMPGVVNAALRFGPLARLIKKITKIHPQRHIPPIAQESFFAWAHRKGLDRETDQHPKVAQAGYDLICSCPTCGFLMKVLLKERAFYSEAYQRSVHAGIDEIKVPEPKAVKPGFVCLKKSMYQAILKDDGYFSALDPLDRIALSHRVMDLGEYLDHLYGEKRLNTHFGKLDGHMAYFAPCHQREQEIGTPYEKLLQLIPGLSIFQMLQAVVK